MTFDEKVQRHKELSTQISELEEERKALSIEILELMPKELKVMTAGIYQVKKQSRILIKTSIEEARVFEAVLMQEVVDKDKLKKLHAIGQPIPNLSEYTYITVSKTK